MDRYQKKNKAIMGWGEIERVELSALNKRSRSVVLDG